MLSYLYLFTALIKFCSFYTPVPKIGKFSERDSRFHAGSCGRLDTGLLNVSSFQYFECFSLNLG